MNADERNITNRRVRRGAERTQLTYPTGFQARFGSSVLKDINTGYISNWDADWFYHFQLGGYETIFGYQTTADIDYI